MNSSALHIMVKEGWVTEEKLQQAICIAQKFGYSIIKTALNFGLLSRKDYSTFLQQFSVDSIQLRETKFDPAFSTQCDLHHLNAHLYVPLRKNSEGKLLIAFADPFDTSLKKELEKKFNCEVETRTASDLDIIWMIHKHCGRSFVKHAVFNLINRDARSSALITFTARQLFFIFWCIGFATTLLFNFPVITFLTLSILLSAFFLFSTVFKFLLTLKGAGYELHERVSKSELKRLQEHELPIYTVLLPVYKEDKIIRKLIWNLRGIDYPKDRLDVKLLIEEDDSKTLEAVRTLDFPATFEVIIVPFHNPKTKPKACNYGLLFSKGKYLTIYDAEDIPEPDQLKKAICLFEKLPENFIVLQSELNYYNKNENLLTRMFTLEYSYWFDYMLPGLQALDISIPLGGTSNHFKTNRLIELGAWDPFNVTEDADLGVRVFDKGYKVGLINSTTLEEANNEFFNWIRQRSRWIKGYMQTYFVHMRDPRALIKKIGWRGFLGFNFFVGATPFTFLIYPVLLLSTLLSIFFPLSTMNSIFPEWLTAISTFNLIAGNIIMIYINMMAVFKRRYYELILFALLNPLYWLMHSIAAYKAVWQLVMNPFFWEKTHHGLTKVSAAGSVKNRLA